MSQVIDFSQYRKGPGVSIPESAQEGNEVVSSEGTREGSSDPWGVVEIIASAMSRFIPEVLMKTFEAVKREGLFPGIPLYIQFNTQATGVAIPQWLRAKYPEDMIIVMENSGEVMDVNHERVVLRLTFSGTVTEILVPYRAIRFITVPDREILIPGFPTE